MRQVTYKQIPSANLSYSKSNNRHVWSFITKLFAFILVCCCVIFYICIDILPSANVTITPKVKLVNLESSYDITITSDNVAGINTQEDFIQVEKLEVEESLTDSFITTKVKDLGTKATGRITLSNRTDKAIYIPKNTLVTIQSSSILKYYTMNDIIVPKSISNFNGIQFGTIDVNIIAEGTDPQYNINAQGGRNIFLVDKYKSSELTATNYTNISGSNVKLTKIVTEEDISSLQNKIKDNLKLNLEKTLTSKYKSDYIFIVNNPRFTELDISQSSPANSATDKLTLSYSMRVTSFGVKKTIVEKLAKDKFLTEVAKIRSSQFGELTQENSEKYSLQVTLDEVIEDKSNKLNIKIEGKLLPLIDNNKVIDEIKNTKELNVSSGAIVLDKYEDYLINNITFQPEWLPDFFKKIPNNKDKISIDVRNIDL